MTRHSTQVGLHNLSVYKLFAWNMSHFDYTCYIHVGLL